MIPENFQYILTLPMLKYSLEEYLIWANSYTESQWTQIVDGKNKYDYYEIRGSEIGQHHLSQHLMKQFLIPLNEERTALHRMAPKSFVPIHIDHALTGTPRLSVLIIPFQYPCDGVNYYDPSGNKKKSSIYRSPVIIRANLPHDVFNNLNTNRFSIQYSLDEPLDFYIDLHHKNKLLNLNI